MWCFPPRVNVVDGLNWYSSENREMSRNNLEVEITKCSDHLKGLNSEREEVKDDCKFPVANK